MPTARPRHTVTETDEVARALDEAAARWPEDREHRGRLLIRLLEVGHETVRAERADVRNDRIEMIEATAGAATGSYDAKYLDDLRRDWPA